MIMHTVSEIIAAASQLDGEQLRKLRCELDRLNHSIIPPEESPNGLEQAFATAQGENIAWLSAEESNLIDSHPEWVNKFVAVASRTEAKVLTVADERPLALEQAMRAPALQELARRENLAPGILFTVFALGEP
jgi:hypothetical protein